MAGKCPGCPFLILLSQPPLSEYSESASGFDLAQKFTGSETSVFKTCLGGESRNSLKGELNKLLLVSQKVN